MTPLWIPQTKKEAYRLLCWSSLRLNAEAGLRLHHELCERRLVEHGDIGQHLAVDIDCRLLQAVHEHAVAHALLASRRIDTGDPQGTELTLLLATVTVGILACLHHRLFGDAIYVLSATAVTLGLGENLLVTCARYYTTFNSWHDLLLMRMASWRARTPYWFHEHRLHRATGACSWWSSWSGC